METVPDFIFVGSKITVDGDYSHEIKRHFLLGKKQTTIYDQPRPIKKQRHYFANKGMSSQSYGFSSFHVWMWELDCEKNWELKNWCFWTVLLEKTIESPLGSRDIQPVNPKGNYSFSELKEIHWKNLCWSWNSNILPTWLELTHWKRPWSWARLKAEGEGYDRGWDGWMTSPTQWTWLWASSRSLWRTRKPDMLQSMGSQRVGHDWEIELNWIIRFIR